MKNFRHHNLSFFRKNNLAAIRTSSFLVVLILSAVFYASGFFIFQPIYAEEGGYGYGYSNLFTQTVTLETGWNIFSVARLVDSHVFSAQETSSNFDIYLLNTSDPSSWSTMQAMGQTEFTPLFGYFINNKTGQQQTLTLTYKQNVEPNKRLFERALTVGWNVLGVANPSYALKQKDSNSLDTNNVKNILNSISNCASYVLDFTDDQVSKQSVKIGDVWKQKTFTDANTLTDLRETKAYAVYLTSTCTYQGFQNNDSVKLTSDQTNDATALRIDKSSTGAPAANITKGATDVLLGAFDFVVQGEPVNVYSIVLDMDLTGTGSSSDITDITLVNSGGTVLASPSNGVDALGSQDGTATFSGTVTFPVGTTQVLVKGSVGNHFGNNDTVKTGFDTPATKITSVAGSNTGSVIMPTPSTAVWGNTMTVRTGVLTVSVAGTPVSQTVIAGITGFTFANYIFDASASGENIKITSIELQQKTNSIENVSNITGIVLYDGTTALNTGSNVLDPDGQNTTNQYIVVLDNPLIIPIGTQKTVALKGNISGSAPSGSTQQWGLKEGAAITAVGVSTTNDIGESVNAFAGSIMTISGGGQYSVALDSSTPTGKLIAANTTGNIMTVLKFYATSEQINVTKVRLALTNINSSGNDLSQVYLYNGSTLLGQGTLGIGNAKGGSGSASSTFTLTTPLQIPANTYKLVTIKADIAPIYTTNTVATAGHQIVIDYYGSRLATENMGTGVSSGTQITGYSPTTNQTPSYIYKSIPTVAAVALPTTTLSNSTSAIYKFSVSADAKGDIDLYKFTFKIATSGPTETTPLAISNITLVDVTSGAEVILNASTTNFYVSRGNIVEEILLASPGTQNLAITTRTVSAGTTRTFELRADFTGTIANSSVTCQLEGDSARVANTAMDMWTRDIVEADVNDDFIWSDLSDVDHTSTEFGATATDYTNGYLINGLPSSNLSSQTLSR